MPSPQVYEVVRPLVSLLDTQRDGLQNYEALLGLTNLSGRSDKLRYVGKVERTEGHRGLHSVWLKY